MHTKKRRAIFFRHFGLMAVMVFVCLGLVGLAASSVLNLFPLQPSVPCTVTGVLERRDNVYAERAGFTSQSTSLDMHLPERKGDCPTHMPLVVWVHGGSFTGGDRALSIEHKKKLFTDAGWAFVSVGYRLTSPQRSIPHPAQADDVASALGWLHHNRDQYHLDTEKTMLVGYSAGAYLVSLISTDNTYAFSGKYPEENIICTVSLDTGAYDLPRYMRSDDGAVGVYRDILGSDENSWRKHSPLHLAASARHLPDFLLVTRGEGVRPAISHSFSETLSTRGVQAKVLEANRYTHGDLDVQLGAPSDSLLTTEVTKFLRSCVDMK